MYRTEIVPDQETANSGTPASSSNAGQEKRKAGKPRLQYAALPFRFGATGEVEIMLITSRETRRWVIPKGWPIKGLEPHETAEREAFEEAGLRGCAAKRPVGRYRYEKRLQQSTVLCEVAVYPFAVTTQRKRWPEQHQREGRWFSAEEAANAVREEDLQRLIRSFGAKGASIMTGRASRTATKTLSRLKMREAAAGPVG